MAQRLMYPTAGLYQLSLAHDAAYDSTSGAVVQEESLTLPTNNRKSVLLVPNPIAAVRLQTVELEVTHMSLLEINWGGTGMGPHRVGLMFCEGMHFPLLGPVVHSTHG